MKPADPIADLIRGAGPDTRRLVSAAQGALAKLGFSVKATGAIDGNTRSALAEFEKARHLPVSSEITPKLVKTLNAAVAAN
jgi:peptidoglycan hydrolase-like protein with peptidoglycan-binding domain